MSTIVYTLIMTQVIPVTQARKDLLKLVDQIDDRYTRVDLTKNGRIKATLVSPYYLESLEEPIYSLKHSLKDIQKAEKEIKKGEFVKQETLEKYLQKRLRNAG